MRIFLKKILNLKNKFHNYKIKYKNKKNNNK